MRKIFIFFTFLIFVILFCSCRNSNSYSNNLNDFQSKENFSSEENESKNLIFTTELEEYSADVKKIVFTIENPNQEKAYYSVYSFTLEKQIHGKWETVSFKNEDITFLLLAREVAPGTKNEGEIDLEKYFNLPLEAGEYRIVKDHFESNSFIIK